MKLLLTMLAAVLLITACSTAPVQEESVSDTSEAAVEATSSSTAAVTKESYYVLTDPAVVEALDSAEYKMLINLETYLSDGAIQEMWDMMKDSAAETGILVEEEDDPMRSKFRNIQYLDTEFGMINSFGYTLRYRQKYDDFTGIGSAGNVMDSKYDITIKFRDADLEKSLSMPLSVGSEFDSIAKKPEMEADISPYGMIFTNSIKVKPKVEDFGPFVDLFEPTLESYAALYPELLGLPLPAGSSITPVAGLTILEEKVEPAILVLDCGAEMEVAFSVFYMNGEALVSEISFDFDTEYESDKKMSLEDFRQVETFYTSLLGKYSDRLDFGWSKTKFVYDILFPNAD